MPPDRLPLAARIELTQRVIALSTADFTTVAWHECSEGSAQDGARGRRTDESDRREVTVRVRISGRSGTARTASSDPGELQRALRSALASARLSPPSPEWQLERLDQPIATAPGPSEALTAVRAGAELARRSDRRRAMLLRWQGAELVVGSTRHEPRIATLERCTFEARTGRRPGSGFAAATAASFDRLDLDALIDSAQSLEPTRLADDDLGARRPAVLAVEAIAPLIEAFGRLALSGRRKLDEPASTVSRLSPLLELADDPESPEGLPQPFDFDGAAKRSLAFVQGGLAGPVATDLELGARLGLPSTAHGFASEDAWPTHLRMAPGDAADSDLLAAAADGVWLGSLEQLRAVGDRSLTFRALARNLRRIGPDGKLAEALPPRIWSGSLLDVLRSIERIAAGSRLWSTGYGPFGAISASTVGLRSISGFSAPRALPVR